jgi:glutamate synthase (ferredoxin)
LRAKFPGTPEHVIHFFGHLAEEVREILAELGAHSLDEIIGRSDLLGQVTTGHERADQLDLSALLVSPSGPDDLTRWSGARLTYTVGELNARILGDIVPLLGQDMAVQRAYPITNIDRTIGAGLAGEIAQRKLQLHPGAIELSFVGSAGQSFGAFAINGIRLDLEGEANDYVGKGLGGGEIIVRPPSTARYNAAHSTIIGNTVLYGATAGALWAAGQAGERFAVRNSGALAVVEGVGDHGCEYMTGGLVVVLGATGRNFGAGMSGGRAYIYDTNGDFPTRINPDMVAAEPLSEDWQVDELRVLVEQHVERTGSTQGQEILAHWEQARHQFWHVVPRSVVASPVTLPMNRVADRVKVPAAI